MDGHGRHVDPLHKLTLRKFADFLVKSMLHLA